MFGRAGRDRTLNLSEDSENESTEQSRNPSPIQEISSRLSNDKPLLLLGSLMDTGNILPTLVLTSLICGSMAVYLRFLRRYKTAVDVPTRLYQTHGTIHGRIVSVGDADNFRVFHTPGGILAGWGWARKVPFEHLWKHNRSGLSTFFMPAHTTPSLPTTPATRARKSQKKNSSIWKILFGDDTIKRPRQTPHRPKLSAETIHIRLCGIDAPESASFGHPAQPFSKEAKQWLTNFVIGKTATVRLDSLDQYHRAVGKVTVWSGLWRKDVSAEMLKAGWALVYESNTNASFGSTREQYDKLEKQARKKRVGMWKSSKVLETPSEYKHRMKAGG
ncbi:putative endonuclease LCL3 [Myxozyma melibiosi]|uniref:Probable endonuclease LCL3 n=1 Tax=Myxozyma melibiosi TaxID=54550 RepID=A0ABR1F4F0_9ASCO